MIPPFTPSGILHSQLPNTAFSIVEEVYSKLPALMNLRDMLYALDKNPDFFSNKFTSTDYYGVSFSSEFITSFGYENTKKDMQILATHIEGDNSYTRFFFKDLVQTEGVTLFNTFLLPKTRDISTFTVYSKDRSQTLDITVTSGSNMYAVDDEGNVTSYSINTAQSLLEILPSWNSCRVTGGSGSSNSGGGDSFWEAATSSTFVPYYVTFSDIPKSVADLCFIRIDTDTYVPLYWVSGTTYAMPIPYVSKQYNVANAPYVYAYFSSVRLHLPCHFEALDGNTYWFQPSYIDLYADNGPHSAEGNHFYITSSIYSYTDAGQANQYRSLLQDNITSDDTVFTFNSIKPSNEKQIYLGNNA